MTTSVRPAAWAARTFCLSPPIGSTRPCSVTSPVIPTVCLTGRPVSSDVSAVVIVIPALGPSLGIAPAGTWTWNSRPSRRPRSMPSASAWPRTYESAIRADSFITSPSWPVRTKPSLPVHRGRLDEQDVAAGAGHREAGRDARQRGPLGGLLEEALPAERLADRVGVDRHRRLGLAAGDPRRRLAQHLAELALEPADAGLAGVLGHDRLAGRSSSISTSSASSPLRSSWRGHR